MISSVDQEPQEAFARKMHWRRQYLYEHEHRLGLERKNAELLSGRLALEQNVQELLREKLALLEDKRRLLERNARLEEENKRLRKAANARNGRESYFGSSTPSSKLPPQPNSSLENQNRKGGAKPGHRGSGRRKIKQQDTDEVVCVDNIPEYCACGGHVAPNGYEERTVIDYIPAKTVTKVIRIKKGLCGGCGKRHVAPVAGVAPRALYSNRILSHAAVEHYVYGHSIGEVSARMGINEGALFNAFHHYADLLVPTVDQLIKAYRASPLKHADETGWKCDGKGGYAWLFTTQEIAIYCFAHTRSQIVADKIFGNKMLPGILCVDRYAGYNHVQCLIQYCFAHLKRDVDDLEKEFPQESEVITFVRAFSPLLAQAMKLRNMPFSLNKFLKKAEQLKQKILQACLADAKHPAIQKIQNIFRENTGKLFHWTKSPDIPADNNFAERDFRKTVIARKISFGSQSDKGRKTRSVLMSILHTAQKNGRDPADAFENILNAIQMGNNTKLIPLLM
jgi:hypothetical protein